MQDKNWSHDLKLYLWRSSIMHQNTLQSSCNFLSKPSILSK
jgi:hypothetical protein